MKLKIFSLLFFCLCVFSVQAQDRARVESGIAQVERLISASKWHDAFSKMRDVEQLAKGQPELQYLTAKQRLKMYKRIHKNREADENMQRMEQLALRSGDTPTIEDMLHFKAGYYASKGDVKVARECYNVMFQRRAKGAKDDASMEKTFTSMISEAGKLHNNTMKDVVSTLYTQWQDSIAAVKAGKELKEIKDKYAASQQEIEDKASTIGSQKGVIILFAVLLVALIVVLCMALLITFRQIATAKKLRRDLKVSNDNSAQKSILIRNIGGQIAPSLSQIAQGSNSSLHVKALDKMLSDVQTYVELDDSKGEKLEIESTNVSTLCEAVVQACSSCRVAVRTDAPSLNFSVAVDTVRDILQKIISESAICTDTEHITLGFKKRNPHMGQFTVSVTGMRFTDEQKEILFTAFAKVYDLTQTTGLVFPICSLMAYKMGGSLTLDDTFAKGTRFVLEVHC